jgi:hypothetical protein
LGTHKNNSVLFDKKNRSHYFYIEYNKIQNSCSSNIYQRIFSAANSHQGSFLRISGYDIASRLEIVGKETTTDEEIRTNYITLPHFVTLKDEIMRTLQNKRPINPNNKNHVKNIKNSEQLKY